MQDTDGSHSPTTVTCKEEPEDPGPQRSARDKNDEHHG